MGLGHCYAILQGSNMITHYHLGVCTGIYMADNQKLFEERGEESDEVCLRSVVKSLLILI